ncbi:MAG: isoprenyl transferase [Saprospiraceae bacterium]|nr:isoprenyl transferase [Saprospiraceae bacterium]
MSELKKRIDINRLPKHIAIIMDGNGRWAKSRNLARIFGHRSGIKSVKDITEACAELGIQYLTLYTFSTENWNRPEDEVSGLMSLLIKTVESELASLTKNNIQLRSIGDLNGLPSKTRNALLNAIENTKNNTRMTLILALNYSGKSELTHSVNQIIQKINDGKLSLPVTESDITNNLYTHDIPDPELLIRTSGEYRLSNFLIWQSAYTELYFTDVFWPDFKEQNLFEAIIDYQSRERRFGMTTEQVTKSRES